MSKNMVEKYSGTYLRWKDDIKKMQAELKSETKAVKKAEKEIENLNKKYRAEKDQTKKDAYKLKLDDLISDYKEKKADLELKNEVLEKKLGRLEQKEQDIIENDPDVKSYIEYAKAKTYDEKVEKDKIAVSRNNRVLSTLNNNPELKKIAIEYLEKSDEVDTLKAEIAKLKANKKQKTADAKTDEDLKPAEDKKKELEDKIKDYIDNLNKTSLRPIRFAEVMGVINNISMVRDEAGKLNLDASVEQENTKLHKNIERNRTLLANVVEKSYNDDNVVLEGFSNYTITFSKQAPAKGQTEEQYREKREAEIRSDLEAKYELNKPVQYEKWYSKLIHPIKAWKESKDIKEKRNALEEEFEKEAEKIHDEFEEKLANAAKSRRTVTRSDFNEYSFGKDSKKVIDEIIKKEIEAEGKAYDEQQKAKKPENKPEEKDEEEER